MTYLTQQPPSLTRFIRSKYKIAVDRSEWVRSVPAAQPGFPGWWTLSVLFVVSQCLCYILFKRQCQSQLELSESGRVAFGHGVIKHVEKTKVQIMVGKRREHLTKDLGAQGSQRKTGEQNREQRQASGVKEKSFRAQRGLGRFCSAQENTDMTKIKLKNKEWFVQNPFYFYPDLNNLG